jgi:hypothetical protein
MNIHTDCNVIELGTRRIQNVRHWHVFVLLVSSDVCATSEFGNHFVENQASINKVLPISNNHMDIIWQYSNKRNLV